MHHVMKTERLVLDLSGVEFLGTAGFSALHTVNVRCAGENVDWALVPSAAVMGGDYAFRTCVSRP